MDLQRAHDQDRGGQALMACSEQDAFGPELLPLGQNPFEAMAEADLFPIFNVCSKLL